MHPGLISNVSCLQGPSFSLTFVKLDGAKIVAVKNNKSLSHLGLKTVVTFVSEVGRLFSLFAKTNKRVDELKLTAHDERICFSTTEHGDSK